MNNKQFEDQNKYELARDLLKLNKSELKFKVNSIKEKELLEFLKYLDHDEITDLLQVRHNAHKILKKLNEETRKKVEFLLRFEPESAAGMMSLNYLIVSKEDNLNQVLKHVKKHENKTGKFPEILVEYEDALLGEIKGHTLALNKRIDKVKNHIAHVNTLKFDADKREVLNTFKKHKHDKVVVVDEKHRVLGIIYSDDILSLIHEESSKHIYSLSGVDEDESIRDGPFKKVKNRASWLIIHLMTSFVAVFIISFFESTIESLVLLAFYMPVVAGMGGNAGTQTMAVVIRGLALKQIELKKSSKIILNEILAGGLNGIINGIIVALVALLWNKNPLLGLVLFLAMIINLVLAGLFGAITPLILNYFGKDPASSSVTFITAATDIFGFFVFLGLATILL